MFTQNDVNAAINYSNNAAVFSMYTITKTGQIRFDVRNMHITELNKLLTKTINTQAELDALKKQMRKTIKQHSAVLAVLQKQYN